MYLWSAVSLLQGLPGLPGLKVSIMSEDLMSYDAKIEMCRTNSCCISHRRVTLAAFSGSFRSKETEAFPEHQDSLYVLHTQTHPEDGSCLIVLPVYCTLFQGPNGPIGPVGPPGPRGSTGPKVSSFSPSVIDSLFCSRFREKVEYWCNVCFTGRSWSPRPTWREGEVSDWEPPLRFF